MIDIHHRYNVANIIGAFSDETLKDCRRDKSFERTLFIMSIKALNISEHNISSTVALKARYTKHVIRRD